MKKNTILSTLCFLLLSLIVNAGKEKKEKLENFKNFKKPSFLNFSCLIEEEKQRQKKLEQAIKNLQTAISQSNKENIFKLCRNYNLKNLTFGPLKDPLLNYAVKKNSSIEVFEELLKCGVSPFAVNSDGERASQLPMPNQDIKDFLDAAELEQKMRNLEFF